MSKEPHGKLDPHVAVRDPGSLPKLVQAGMYRLIMRETGGSDPDPDTFIKAFNIITWSLLTAGTTRSNTTDATLRGKPMAPKLRQVLNPGKKKKTAKKRKPVKATRDGSEARVKVDPKDPTRVKLTPIGKEIEKAKLKRPTPSTKTPRARSRKKEPWVPFDEKERQLAGWARSIYDNDPAKYEMTYQEAKRRGA